MLRRLALLWFVAAAAAAYGGPVPPYEVVRDHVEIDVAADGTYTARRAETYRILDETGIKLLQQRRLSFTPGYEALDIVEAYTLKPDGTRIDVARTDIAAGWAGTDRSYFDRQVLRVAFTDLAVQDRIVLVTALRQIKPWFPGHFDMRAVFSRTIAAHDVVYRVNAPATLMLHIDAEGLSGGTPERDETGVHWIWQYANDAPLLLAVDAVSESDFAPHLHLSTFSGYDEVAQAYREGAKNRAAVSKTIAALAKSLTRGVSDKREQARVLYEWVCANISYIAIELGTGGFSPHAAEDVLLNRFGDCKDRAVLLEALLSAKGIESTAVLIDAGSVSYRLPTVASPHAFDHVITYIPAFDLFVDASDAFAPFGVLPFADAGKPALLAASGQVVQTPVAGPEGAQVHVAADIVVKEDGSAEGHTTLSATGAYGVGLRAWMQATAQTKDADLLRQVFGPGAEGRIERGTPSLRDPFVLTAAYRIPGVVEGPGPAALPQTLSFRPFSFADLAAGHLPGERNSAYVCPSMAADETLSLHLPETVAFFSIPKSETVETAQVRLQIAVTRDGQSLTQKTMLVVDHPDARCTPAYYQAVRPDLKKMAGLLRRQIVYRAAEPAKP